MTLMLSGVSGVFVEVRTSCERQCIAPTEKQVKMNTLDIWLVANGKAIENWVQLDMLGLMQQLGVVPTPAQIR